MLFFSFLLGLATHSDLIDRSLTVKKNSVKITLVIAHYFFCVIFVSTVGFIFVCGSVVSTVHRTKKKLGKTRYRFEKLVDSAQSSGMPEIRRRIVDVWAFALPLVNTKMALESSVNRVLPCLMAFYRVFTEFRRVWCICTGFYWVKLGYTGFYWVLVHSIGFYWVLLEFT